MKHKLIVLAVLLLCATGMSAAVIGELNLTSGGGGVTVTLNSIDWYTPVGPPDGPFIVGGSENDPLSSGLFYGPGSANEVPVGTNGRILDLTLNVPPGGPFLDFPTIPGLDFYLTSTGPGVANTNCTTAFLSSQPVKSCSPVAGSPFILTLVANAQGGYDTAVSFAVGGVAVDTTGKQSDWQGAFTTQFARKTPQQIKADILGNNPNDPNADGKISSTHSGSFELTFIPEPSTYALMGAGLLAIGFIGRRHKA